MDIIATRPSFGDFGRVKKGQILLDVAKTQAEKMTATRAFRPATSADKEAAEKRKKTPVVGAKAKADAQAKTASSDAYDALRSEVDELRQLLGDLLEKNRSAWEAFGAEVEKKLASAVSGFEKKFAAATDDIKKLNAHVAGEQQKVPQATGGDGGKK